MRNPFKKQPKCDWDTRVSPVVTKPTETDPKALRPANEAKRREMSGLLTLLKDDDINPVFCAMHRAMTELGFRFTGDAPDLINALEKANPDVRY